MRIFLTLNSKWNMENYQNNVWISSKTDWYEIDSTSSGKSFNDFIHTKVEHIIEGFNDIEISHKLNQNIGDFKFNIKFNASANSCVFFKTLNSILTFIETFSNSTFSNI